MDYRKYLMQMVQRGKVIKMGGKLHIMNTEPYYKNLFQVQQVYIVEVVV